MWSLILQSYQTVCQVIKMTSDSHFCNAVFRYRSIQSLLGEHEELERQTVYFSPPEYLNDPMEGLRQIYWRGDRITWRNLLRHYIICIHNRFFEALLSRDTECLPSDTIAVFQSLHNFPTSQVKSLCQACITAVEASDLHTALLDFLAKADRDISFTELQQLLRTVHLDWLYLIQKPSKIEHWSHLPTGTTGFSGGGQSHSHAPGNKSRNSRKVFYYWSRCHS